MLFQERLWRDLYIGMQLRIFFINSQVHCVRGMKATVVGQIFQMRILQRKLVELRVRKCDL